MITLFTVFYCMTIAGTEQCRPVDANAYHDRAACAERLVTGYRGDPHFVCMTATVPAWRPVRG